MDEPLNGWIVTFFCRLLPEALLIFPQHTLSLNDPSGLVLPFTGTLVAFSLEFW